MIIITNSLWCGFQYIFHLNFVVKLDITFQINRKLVTTALCKKFFNIISKTCEHLEELILHDFAVKYQDVIHLCGFQSTEFFSFQDVLDGIHTSTARCLNIRKLSFPLGPGGKFSAALLLQVFKFLEEADIYDNCGLHDGLNIIHKHDSRDYSLIDFQYNLVSLLNPINLSILFKFMYYLHTLICAYI